MSDIEAALWSSSPSCDNSPYLLLSQGSAPPATPVVPGCAGQTLSFDQSDLTSPQKQLDAVETGGGQGVIRDEP